MRLKKIKLAGFKSFVDPTTVELDSNRVAIVGPNGCGKSNVIDAVRWVMGESSAKQLRGESMADVIFNGSSGRASVGQASVELIFDNSDGSLGGEYAAFSELAIKRLVTRDGQSNYYLNNARCRRKDITDIFLGTGLGPRSYAIIEQGMISRLIEAKPEDLRNFLEEAAGISKYKDRRRETENRIGHTRENLERLMDLRDELNKQLIRLEKQAEAAEKYKELKKILRQVSAEHHALKWREFDTDITLQHRVLSEKETEVEKAVAFMRELDANIEKERVAYDAAQEGVQTAQSAYYRSAAQVSKFEQAIAHQRERQAQLDMDLAEILESLAELEQVRTTDTEQLDALRTQIDALTPKASELSHQYQDSYRALAIAEESMRDWQQSWENLNHRLATTNQQKQVAEAKIAHLEDTIQGNNTRLQLLQDNEIVLANTDLSDELTSLQAQSQESATQLSQAQAELSSLQQQLRNQQAENEHLEEAIEGARETFQRVQNEKISLQALQQAAFGEHQDNTKQWLAEKQLSSHQRLVQQLVVDPDWICAVETVLGDYLQAICVDHLSQFAESIADFSQGTLVLFETHPSEADTPVNSQHTPLLEKIKTPLRLQHVLQGVYCVDTLTQALSIQKTLAVGESVVTKDGVWLSPEWLRVSRQVNHQDGVLAREQRLQVLQADAERLHIELQQLQQTLVQGKEQVKLLSEQSQSAQQQVNQFARRDADIQAEQRALMVKQQELFNQKERVTQEIAELTSRIMQQQDNLTHAKAMQEDALEAHEALHAEKIQLEAMRLELTKALEHAKNKAHADHADSNQIQVQLSGLTHRLEATQNHVARNEQQLSKLKARETQLQQARRESNDPLDSMTMELENAIEQQVNDEAHMQESRANLDAIAQALRELEQMRLASEEKVQLLRQTLEAYRLALQTVRVKRDTVFEQLQALEVDLSALLESLSHDATPQNWAEKEEKLENQIKRLGAINLAAIDEYNEHAERLQYLDKQHEDLTSALTTLQEAIEKIDKETKQRFKETFDAVNNGLGTLFTQVFGGGHASLELTDDDLLNTGIALMAQPPGKRNSSIHMLSGGEKALTALSLVFSMFRLNPAPFCMLDEVDAPLDDANVMRFARMVKEMSEHIQFIFITHNKGTMEMADHLMGVTMKEAGVSRLVSVDVDKAVELAVA